MGGIITEDGRSENEIMRSRMSHLMDATGKYKETTITSESRPLIIIEITAPMKLSETMQGNIGIHGTSEDPVPAMGHILKCDREPKVGLVLEKLMTYWRS